MQERTYVVGPNGGKLDSVKIKNFTGDDDCSSLQPNSMLQSDTKVPGLLLHSYASQRFH